MFRIVRAASRSGAVGRCVPGGGLERQVHRRGDRDPQIWNIACDHRINNDLLADGYSFKDLKPCLDINYKNMVEEDIYEDLLSKPRHIILVGSWTGLPLNRGVAARGSEETEEDDEIGDGDMLPGQEEDDPTGVDALAVVAGKNGVDDPLGRVA